MDDTITTTIYCLCEDFLKTMSRRRDDPQTRLSTAEVMTVPLVVAATFFGGEIEKTRRFLHEYGYMPKMISKSHLNRRIHAIEPMLWRVLFELLAKAFKERNDPDRTYAVDSLPVPACDNIRIRRCRLYPPVQEGHDDDDDALPKRKSFRGYVASKRRYFYGLRVHLVVTGAGEPVEFSLAAGSEADVTVFKELELDLPEGSIICADKAYTDYDYEDLLEEVGLHLKAQRKKKELQEAAFGVGGVLGQADSPIHRDGVQSADGLLPQEDPRGDAQRLRAKDRLLPAGFLHSVLVGGNQVS